MSSHLRGATALARAGEQIAVHIHKALGAGKDRINIQLRPPELGRIEVKFELVDNRLNHVVIAVDKPETLDLLQRDVRGLERALQDAGLKTDSGSLQFSLRDNGRGERHPALTPGPLDSPDSDAAANALPHPPPQGRGTSPGLGAGIDINV